MVYTIYHMLHYFGGYDFNSNKCYMGLLTRRQPAPPRRPYAFPLTPSPLRLPLYPFRLLHTLPDCLRGRPSDGSPPPGCTLPGQQLNSG